MAKITFYEKPGCINNEKQKKVLRAAGHELVCIDILTHPWTREELLRFVEGKNPAQSINHTAPAVKNGTITPAELTADEALELMLADTILIRRPLVVVDGLHLQGFTDRRLAPYLGDWDGSEDIVTCPNLQTIPCDERMGS